jgi:hypothetical protein
MSMGRVIAILASGVVLASCSMSMPSMEFFKSGPSSDVLRVESEPPGADVRTSEGQNCRTPCELTVAVTNDFTVTYSLNGYQPHTVQVRSDPDGSKLQPNPVFAELKSLSSPAAKKKPAAKKVAAKKKPDQTQGSAFEPTTATTPTSTSTSTSSSPSAFPWPDPPR